MAKAKSNTPRNVKPFSPVGAKHSAAQRAKTRAPRAAVGLRPEASAQKAGTKRARVLAMLRSPEGTTNTAIMKKTGWQQHSVRGYLAGFVRKRLKLDLVSSLIVILTEFPETHWTIGTVRNWMGGIYYSDAHSKHLGLVLRYSGSDHRIGSCSELEAPPPISEV